MKREAARVLTIGVVAGLAGGLAEVAWISLYAAVTSSDAALVARGVTETLRINSPAPVLAGVSIHFALAALLGIAVAFAIQPLRLAGARLFGATLWALAAVWAVNFMIVLPSLNPAFVEIVPLAISFVSKLSFGLGAAMCLQLSMRPERVEATA
jgi:hypothetical protein